MDLVFLTWCSAWSRPMYNWGLKCVEFVEAWVWDCGPENLDHWVGCLWAQVTEALCACSSDPEAAIHRKVQGQRVSLTLHTSIAFPCSWIWGFHGEEHVVLNFCCDKSHTFKLVFLQKIRPIISCLHIIHIKEHYCPFCIWVIRYTSVKETKEHFLPKGIWNQFDGILKLKYSLPCHYAENAIRIFYCSGTWSEKTFCLFM